MVLTYAHTSQTTSFIDNEIPFIRFPQLSQLDWLTNGFSTRLGGVSSGHCESMNLSFTRGDDPAKVLENFRRIGHALSIRVDDMVMSDQTHTANVLRITEDRKGMGILRERNFCDVDGLITDTPGVCLVTSHADCVPVYFVDPVHRAIGLSHAGWKGTLHNIARNTVQAMQDCFGTIPSDLSVVIGPSICRNCYEIGPDVAEEYATAYGPEVFDRILTPIPEKISEGKFLLNLWEANRTNLIRAGVTPSQIGITDLCTCCNPTLFHSHRASKGQRGGQCAFLMIK